MTDLQQISSTDEIPANRPLYDALQESLNEIEIFFGETGPSFKKDRGNTASSRERSVKSFLESYFPSDWTVKKGPIYDTYGNFSKEVDCALCVPQHPPLTTPNRDLVLAEGVHAAIEVKPDISSLGETGQFLVSLNQAATVKCLQRRIHFLSRKASKEWPAEVHKIPYLVFSKKIASLEQVMQFMEDQKEKNRWSPWDLPDIVVGYDSGIVYHFPEASLCSISNLLARQEMKSGEGYLLFPTKKETLTFLLMLLYSFATPQPLISQPILKNYLLPISIPRGTSLFRCD